MPNKIVSAHGGRWSDQAANLRVPAGSRVIYYVADGGILSNDDGFAILGQLQRGHEPGGHVVQDVPAGANTYNYSYWYAPEFADHCGIFQVGSPARVVDISGHDEHNPLLLGDLFAQYPNCTIYWVCCREVSHRGKDAQLRSRRS